MRISSMQMFRQGVDVMLEKQAQLSETELQMASGKRILRPSDDPAASVRILDFKEAEAKIDQYQRNAEFAEGKLAQEETALEGIQNLLQRVRELAVRGNSDTMSSGDRQAIAEEIRQHMDSYLQLANTQDANGEFLFAGYKSQTKPFSHNGLGTFSYNGDAGQRLLQIGDNREIAINDPGTVLTGLPANAGGTTDVGKILYDLAANLQAGSNDSNALTDLDTALGGILNTRAVIGARLNAVAEQQTANDAFKIAVRQVRSSLEDLDYAEAVSRFNQQLTAMQASQQSFLKIQDLNLFNYIR